MGVFRRKDSKVWHMYYKDAEGNIVRKPTGATSKATALEIWKKEMDRVAAIKKGIMVPDEITFNELLGRFFDDQKHHIKDSTLQRYRFSAEKLRPFFGNKILDTIKVLDIEKYRQERAKAVKVATINRDMEFLRHIFNKARKWGMIQKNPVEDIEFYKEDNIRTRYLTEEEVGRLLRECKKTSYLYLAVKIAVNTGMRRGEVLSLQLPQEGDDFDKINWVDLKNRCFHLNITKTGKYRNVPINKELFPHIEKAVGEVTDGRLFSVHIIKNGFEAAMMRAGIKNAVFHDLRRTFISHAMMAGYSQEIIQRVVGQDDPTIFKRYAHLAPDLRLQVIEEVGRIFREEGEIEE